MGTTGHGEYVLRACAGIGGGGQGGGVIGVKR
jgi:hypothetical protein